MEFNYIKVTFNTIPFAVLKMKKGSWEEIYLVDSLIDNGFTLEPCTKRMYDKMVQEDRLVDLEELKNLDLDSFL